MAEVSNVEIEVKIQDLVTYLLFLSAVLSNYITFASPLWANYIQICIFLLFKHCPANIMSKLPTRQLGKNGPFIPRLGLGCMGLSIWYGDTVASDEDRLNFLDGAHERGETFWVTSDRCTPPFPQKYHQITLLTSKL